MGSTEAAECPTTSLSSSSSGALPQVPTASLFSTYPSHSSPLFSKRPTYPSNSPFLLTLMKQAPPQSAVRPPVSPSVYHPLHHPALPHSITAHPSPSESLRIPSPLIRHHIFSTPLHPSPLPPILPTMLVPSAVIHPPEYCAPLALVRSERHGCRVPTHAIHLLAGPELNQWASFVVYPPSPL